MAKSSEPVAASDDQVRALLEQASRATNGSSCCRSASSAMSFNCIARRQIGREKHFGMSSTRRTGRYSGGDQGRFVDAGAAVLSPERMRPRFELPIQDVIKVVHGGRPCGAPPHRMVIPSHLICQSRAGASCVRSLAMPAPWARRQKSSRYHPDGEGHLRATLWSDTHHG